MAADDVEPQGPAPSSSTTDLPIRPGLGRPKTSVPFDIVQTYHDIIESDPHNTTTPVAAIEALIALLQHTQSSTAMETLEVVAHHTALLRASVPNPIPVKAGTELFKQYLVRSLKQQAAPSATVSPFEETRAKLVASSLALAARVRAARAAIADEGARLLLPPDGPHSDGHGAPVVLTAGGSRVVRAMLVRAAELQKDAQGCARFKVIYVTNALFAEQCTSAVAELRAAGVRVAEVDERAVARELEAERVTMVLLGAESVTLQGGILSRLGTYQIAQLARAANKEVTVLCETYKFVQVTVLRQDGLERVGIRQTVTEFKGPEEDEAESKVKREEVPIAHQVDFTPARLINRIITEQGVTYPPAGPYEMILDMYSGRL